MCFGISPDRILTALISKLQGATQQKLKWSISTSPVPQSGSEQSPACRFVWGGGRLFVCFLRSDIPDSPPPSLPPSSHSSLFLCLRRPRRRWPLWTGASSWSRRSWIEPRRDWPRRFWSWRRPRRPPTRARGGWESAPPPTSKRGFNQSEAWIRYESSHGPHSVHSSSCATWLKVLWDAARARYRWLWLSFGFSHRMIALLDFWFTF